MAKFKVGDLVIDDENDIFKIKRMVITGKGCFCVKKEGDIFVDGRYDFDLTLVDKRMNTANLKKRHKEVNH